MGHVFGIISLDPNCRECRVSTGVERLQEIRTVDSVFAWYERAADGALELYRFVITFGLSEWQGQFVRESLAPREAAANTRAEFRRQQ